MLMLEILFVISTPQTDDFRGMAVHSSGFLAGLMVLNGLAKQPTFSKHISI